MSNRLLFEDNPKRTVRGFHRLAAHYGYTSPGSIEYWRAAWEAEGFKPYVKSGRAFEFDLDQIDQWLKGRDRVGTPKDEKVELQQLTAKIESLEAQKITIQNEIASGARIKRQDYIDAQIRSYQSFISDIDMWLDNIGRESKKNNSQVKIKIEKLKTKFFESILSNCPDSGIARDCAYRLFHNTPPMSKLDWMMKYHFLSARATTTKGVRFVPYPFQKGLIYFLGDRRIERFYFQKPAKIGWTQIVKGAIAHELIEEKRNVGCWLPRDQDKNRFLSIQMRSMIEDVPEVRKAMLGEPSKKSENYKADQIVFENSLLYLNGSASEANFTDFDVDLALVEEISQSPKNIGDQGLIEDNAIGRTAGSSEPTFRAGSTPTKVGPCNISRLVSRCREVFQRFVKCDCGSEFVMQFHEDKEKGHKIDFKYIYFNDDKQEGVDIDATKVTARFLCGDCGTLHDYSSLRRLDERGQWRSENYRLDETIWEITDHDGAVCDPPSECAAKMNALLSYDFSWARSVARFVRANLARLDEGEPTAMINFHNECLGEVWNTEEGRNLPKWDVIKSRAEVYEAECPDGVQYITAFIDLHPTFVVAEVKGFGYQFESWSLTYEYQAGSPLTSDVVDRVIKAIDRDWVSKTGKVLRISVIGIDSGWEPTIAYRYHKSQPERFIATKGSAIYGKPIMTPPPKNADRNGVRLCWLGTDTAKDYIYDLLEIDVPGAGYLHYPEQDDNLYSEYDDDFFKGLPSEIKRTKWVNGKEKTQYERRSVMIRNEPLDCCIGNFALMRLLLVRYGAVLVPMLESEENTQQISDVLVTSNKSASDIFDEINANA